MRYANLKPPLRLYFEQEDNYSVITLAGASEEVFSDLLRSQLKAKLRLLLRQEGFIIFTGLAALDELIAKLMKKIRGE